LTDGLGAEHRSTPSTPDRGEDQKGMSTRKAERAHAANRNGGPGEPTAGGGESFALERLANS
jgi:hypothetical protein